MSSYIIFLFVFDSKIYVERVTGVEPVSLPWQGSIIATIRYPREYQEYWELKSPFTVTKDIIAKYIFLTSFF